MIMRLCELNNFLLFRIALNYNSRCTGENIYDLIVGKLWLNETTESENNSSVVGVRTERLL